MGFNFDGNQIDFGDLMCGYGNSDTFPDNKEEISTTISDTDNLVSDNKVLPPDDDANADDIVQNYITDDDSDDMDDDSMNSGLEIEESKNTLMKKSIPKSNKKSVKTIPPNEVIVSLPVSVKSRSFTTAINELGECSLLDVYNKLFEQGYLEVAIASCFYDKSSCTIYIFTPKSATDDQTLVTLNNERNMFIVDGMTKMPLKLESFDGYDPDEIGVEELTEAWTNSNPDYEGCEMYYSSVYEVAYPVLTEEKSCEDIPLPIKVFYEGEFRTISADNFPLLDKVSDKDITHFLCGELPGNVKPSLVMSDSGTYFVTYSPKSSKDELKVTIASKEEKLNSKVKVEKYKLPVEAFIVLYGHKQMLDSTMFDGKEKITRNDLVTYLKPSYKKIFSDKRRTLDVSFSKTLNRISINFTSGEKGADSERNLLLEQAIKRQHRIGKSIKTENTIGLFHVITTNEEYLEALQKERVLATYIPGGNQPAIRLENLPFGTFQAVCDPDCEDSEVRDVTFTLKSSKIPMKLLDSIIAHFRKDLTKEAIVQIYFNTLVQEYFLMYPKIESVGKEFVRFSSSDATISDDDILVMTVHSHNTMRSCFSKIDDADEIYTGLFGVIGTLDKTVVSCNFRAGVEGVFCKLPLNALFA